MSKYKVVLFDVDGVLILPPKLFSDIYAEKRGINPETLTPFYLSKEFRNCSIGKSDLKQAIKAHNDKWQWEGDPAELIDDWLEAENYPNHELLKVVESLRHGGTKVYIVTQQEKYRAAFLRDKVFKGRFDGFLASCDFGVHKETPEFWQKVLEQLNRDVEDLDPEDIIYFDDKQKLVDAAAAAGVRAYIYTKLEDVTQQI
jgi:HAD superfamily hydrolase (TIGR01509 family)